MSYVREKLTTVQLEYQMIVFSEGLTNLMVNLSD